MILNLTQHPATPEQIAAGVVDPAPEDAAYIRALLTVDSLPTRAEIHDRAARIAVRADAIGAESAMIGGAGWMMGQLEGALRAHDITPLHAFSVRESVEQAQPDGSVRKVNVFRHVGFVEGGQ